MYYRECSLCGAHLDPGERCDCRETEKRPPPLLRERPHENRTKPSLSAGQLEVKGDWRCRYGRE